MRLERPAIGTFNGRDIGILFVLSSTIPLFYLVLPRWLLTSFLVVTFLGVDLDRLPARCSARPSCGSASGC